MIIFSSMDWKYDISVALWALIVCNNIVITFQEITTISSNLETTTVFIAEANDTKLNGRENDGHLIVTKKHHHKNKRNRKRSRDLTDESIQKHHKGYYSSHYEQKELLRQLHSMLNSTSSTTSHSGNEDNSTTESPRPREIITYDDLKDVFQTFLYQHLKLISPDLIKYARQARGKKKKYKKFILPMIMGALLVKSLILPIVLKGLAVLSSKAVVLSMISLLVASLSSLKRGARQESEKTEVQVIHVPVKHHGYKRYDEEHEDVTHEDYYHDSHDYGGSHHSHHDRSDPAYYRHHYRSNHNHGNYRDNDRSASTSSQYDQPSKILPIQKR